MNLLLCKDIIDACCTLYIFTLYERIALYLVERDAGRSAMDRNGVPIL
jgi:hypothetical protein